VWVGFLAPLVPQILGFCFFLLGGPPRGGGGGPGRDLLKFKPLKC